MKLEHAAILQVSAQEELLSRFGGKITHLLSFPASFFAIELILHGNKLQRMGSISF